MSSKNGREQRSISSTNVYNYSRRREIVRACDGCCGYGSNVGLELVKKSSGGRILREPIECVLAVHEVKSRLSCPDAFAQRSIRTPHPVFSTRLGRRSQRSGDAAAQKFCRRC